MKFEDILALAKQGYKPADIKELLEIPTEDVSRETSTQKNENDDVLTETEHTFEETKADEPDYKTLYEESQRKLAQAQQQNQHTNIKGTQDDRADGELFAEVARSFML